jgi:phage terminase small subunit
VKRGKRAALKVEVKRGPVAPDHLEPATARWWASVVETWELDEHHVRLLTLAAEAFDRAVQARKVIARTGLTFKDRFGQPKPRPEVVIERDARIAFARLLRELDLDVESPPEHPRPPTLNRMR